MNRKPHDSSELNAFEAQLKSLVPRPPVAAVTLVEQADETNQVAGRRRWWSADADAPYAFYRTVGLSASLGALFGAACTLLMLRVNSVAAPSALPPIAVSTDEVSTSSVSPTHAAANIANNQDSAVASDTSSSIAHVEQQLQITNVQRSMNYHPPRDWLEELRRLKPGTLGVGTRLVSQHPAKLQGAAQESRLDSKELFSADSSTTTAESTVGSRRIDLESVPLPQRQWMQQMLNSPNDFY